MKHRITERMRQEAAQIIDEVYAEILDKENVDDEYFSYFHNDTVHEVLSSYGFSISHGMTRWVWVCDDFVLKFAAKCNQRYCEHEVDVFQEAVRRGYDDAFAQCEKLEKTFAGMPVWIMERVEIDEDAVYTNSSFYKDGMSIEDEEERDNYFEDSHFQYDCCDAARESLETSWGVSFIREVYRFMEEMDVNDVHDSNIGWDGYGYVICDYAGF